MQGKRRASANLVDKDVKSSNDKNRTSRVWETYGKQMCERNGRGKGRMKRRCTCSCGAEKARTSFTDGYCWTASSISKGEMVSPPLLIISFDRPKEMRRRKEGMMWCEREVIEKQERGDTRGVKERERGEDVREIWEGGKREKKKRKVGMTSWKIPTWLLLRTVCLHVRTWYEDVAVFVQTAHISCVEPARLPVYEREEEWWWWEKEGELK